MNSAVPLYGVPPALVGQALALTDFPMLMAKSCRVVPLLFRALGVIISRCQVTILPLASFTSISKYACGFSHARPESEPVRSMHLSLLNSTANPWCANAG